MKVSAREIGLQCKRTTRTVKKEGASNDSAGGISLLRWKTPPTKALPLVRYRRCASLGKCRSVRENCPLSGIRRFSTFGSCKCITSMGIAVGTLTVVRFNGQSPLLRVSVIGGSTVLVVFRTPHE